MQYTLNLSDCVTVYEHWGKENGEDSSTNKKRLVNKDSKRNRSQNLLQWKIKNNLIENSKCQWQHGNQGYKNKNKTSNKRSERPTMGGGRAVFGG